MYPNDIDEELRDEFEFENFYVKNLELLEKILKELHRLNSLKTNRVKFVFDMMSWIAPFGKRADGYAGLTQLSEGYAPKTEVCQTSLCLAGLAFKEDGRYEELLNWYFGKGPETNDYGDWPKDQAEEMLGIGGWESQYLFFADKWPLHYYEMYENGQEIEAAILYLNDIIRENKAYREYLQERGLLES